MNINIHTTLLLFLGRTLFTETFFPPVQFQCHKVAFTADVSLMYRLVLLHKVQCDLHRLVWRVDPQQAFTDFWMTRLTFGFLPRLLQPK